MPEYPDVTLYIERLDAQTRGQRLEGVRLRSPFVLRSVEPPLGECAGRIVAGYRRIGKRIVVDFGDELFLVIHLMIAGRLRWRKVGAGIGGRNALAAFDFAHGTLLFTEASTKKRAWIRVVRGEEALRALDPGGLEIFDATGEQFAERLRSRNHTLKRALTDARENVALRRVRRLARRRARQHAARHRRIAH